MMKWIEDAFYSSFWFRPSLWIAVNTNGDVLESLTPKVLGVFFIKTASKQPLFKAR
jgi:hypothetical protein